MNELPGLRYVDDTPCGVENQGQYSNASCPTLQDRQISQIFRIFGLGVHGVLRLKTGLSLYFMPYQQFKQVKT